VISLPSAALATYEQLRAEVLSGHTRPEGLMPIAYHGILHGLELLLARPAHETTSSGNPGSAASHEPLDSEFLRLLVNMLLQAQEREAHVC
jgi:hypothetical protein